LLPERQGSDTPTAAWLHKKRDSRVSRHNGIELSEQKEVITPGWQGKPKGLFQVLWEQGLIESEALDKCTVDW
jgi:hypothetical protein